MSIKTIFCIAIIYLISIIACKPKADSSSGAELQPTIELPDDFIEFYKQFHQDSQYQISHIVFPLPGMMRDTAGRDSAVTWLEENWIHHQSVTPDDLWSVDFTIPADGVVIEFIYAREEGYWMERRFARMKTEWNLIYYTGLQEAHRGEENEELSE